MPVTSWQRKTRLNGPLRMVCAILITRIDIAPNALERFTEPVCNGDP